MCYLQELGQLSPCLFWFYLENCFRFSMIIMLSRAVYSQARHDSVQAFDQV